MKLHVLFDVYGPEKGSKEAYKAFQRSTGTSTENVNCACALFLQLHIQSTGYQIFDKFPTVLYHGGSS